MIIMKVEFKAKGVLWRIYADTVGATCLMNVTNGITYKSSEPTGDIAASFIRIIYGNYSIEKFKQVLSILALFP